MLQADFNTAKIKPNRDRDPEIAERFLLLGFVSLATVSILGMLGINVHHLLQDCASRLHFAFSQAR